MPADRKWTLSWTRPDPADPTRRDGPFRWTVVYDTRAAAERVRDACQRANEAHGHEYSVEEVNHAR